MPQFPQLPAQSNAPADHQHPRALPNSVGSDALQPDSVGSSHLIANSVGSSEIATGAVGSDEIATDAVGSAEIAANAVGTAEIADAAVTDAKVEASFHRGIIAQQVLTANEAAAHSVSEATDMVLNNVPVVAGHSYAIHLHSAWGLVAGTTCRWLINLHINGTLADRFGEAVQTTSGSNLNGVVDGTCYWVAPTTQATDDFTVEVQEISGSFTFQLQASSTAKRTLTIEDRGVI